MTYIIIHRQRSWCDACEESWLVQRPDGSQITQLSEHEAQVICTALNEDTQPPLFTQEELEEISQCIQRRKLSKG